MPAASCPRCWSANSATYASCAAEICFPGGAAIPNTPHSSCTLSYGALLCFRIRYFMLCLCLFRGIMRLLAHDALHDFLIRLFDAAHVAAEAVLVQLFAGGRVPQAAGVRADLVREHDRAVRGFSELELEIDEGDVQRIEILLHHLIDFEGHGLDQLDFLAGGELQRDRV